MSPFSSAIGLSLPVSSNTTRKSADSARDIARSMPIFSTTSIVSRRPAVSSKVTGSPSRSIFTSITSRVVPAISDVIAASRPAKRLRSVDFPTLGEPRMATSNPCRRRSANTTPAASCSRLARTDRTNSITSGDTSNGTSSSAKSIVASIKAAARSNLARQPSAKTPSAPARTRIAWRRCPSVSASMRSASPST